MISDFDWFPKGMAVLCQVEPYIDTKLKQTVSALEEAGGGVRDIFIRGCQVGTITHSWVAPNVRWQTNFRAQYFPINTFMF